MCRVCESAVSVSSVDLSADIFSSVSARTSCGVEDEVSTGGGALIRIVGAKFFLILFLRFLKSSLRDGRRVA